MAMAKRWRSDERARTISVAWCVPSAVLPVRGATVRDYRAVRAVAAGAVLAAAILWTSARATGKDRLSSAANCSVDTIGGQFSAIFAAFASTRRQ
jgi:hypothetical protein